MVYLEHNNKIITIRLVAREKEVVAHATFIIRQNETFRGQKYSDIWKLGEGVFNENVFNKEK